MCGIAGFIDFKHSTLREDLRKMTACLSHRGPDDEGIQLFEFDSCLVGLGQTRLSIIDLSPLGHQPMSYKDFAIVFNGEIYNFLEVRDQLKRRGHQFGSKSDTEVILHAYEEWGNEAVAHFIGMFAFAILDGRRREIVFFRDRAGVKPFYYYFKNDLFLFGSELKSFHEHPGFHKAIDEDALLSFFEYGYVPAPHCIFQNTRKLEAGHWLRLNLTTKEVICRPYWRVRDYFLRPKARISYEDARDELHALLKSAFAYRMVSDVPVGVFLSGGYDSTAVTALLQANNTGKLKTFTIGFQEGNNEALYAKETAAFLGTDHQEYYCTSKEAQDIIPKLPHFYDEPFADSSAIPTMLVSQFARRQVTVALSADGGDEIFGGYNSYMQLTTKSAVLNNIPTFSKGAVRRLLLATSALIPDRMARLKHHVYGVAKALNKDALQQGADLFTLMSALPNFYRENLFCLPRKESRLIIQPAGFCSEVEWAMCSDYSHYLQGDILTKVDRATMSVSLEGREPFLDHRVVEFAASLPLEFKYDGHTPKKILRDIVHEYVPKEMMDRPKTGFSLPIHKWLSRELSPLLKENLSDDMLKLSGLLNVDFVSKQVRLFESGKLHYVTLIWKLLMFQMWLRKWMC